MPYIVTGISQDGNTTALEASITAAGLSLEPFDIIGPDDTGVTVSTGLVDSGIITGGGLETGTGVPGLTGDPRLSGGASSGLLWARLTDLAIPDDEVENYAGVLEAGRSIIGYHATAANVTPIEELFHTSGLAKVKTF